MARLKKDQKVNKLIDMTIDRVYKCNTCKHLWEITQKLTDDFARKCESCGSEEVGIHSADAGFVVNVDSGKSKTIGMLASKNSEKFEKEGSLKEKLEKDKTRLKARKKINPGILKNPEKYIMTGKA